VLDHDAAGSGIELADLAIGAGGLGHGSTRQQRQDGAASKLAKGFSGSMFHHFDSWFFNVSRSVQGLHTASFVVGLNSLPTTLQA
jgi:hypothetical protein